MLLTLACEVSPISIRDTVALEKRKKEYEQYKQIFEREKSIGNNTEIGSVINLRPMTLQTQKDWGDIILVTNTHVLANPESSDVKYWQVSAMMLIIDNVYQHITHNILNLSMKARAAESHSTKNDNVNSTKKFRPPMLGLVVTGDFNSTPGSAVYNFIVDGYLDANHPEFYNTNKELLTLAIKLDQQWEKEQKNNMDLQNLQIYTPENSLNPITKTWKFRHGYEFLSMNALVRNIYICTI